MPEFKQVNPELTNLLRNMMNKDASKRPSINEVLGKYSTLVGKITSVPGPNRRRRKA